MFKADPATNPKESASAPSPFPLYNHPMDLDEYDRQEREMIMKEHEKKDGRTPEQIIEDVKRQTLPTYLALVKALNPKTQG